MAMCCDVNKMKAGLTGDLRNPSSEDIRYSVVRDEYEKGSGLKASLLND